MNILKSGGRACVAAVAALFLVTACAQEPGPKEGLGTVLGGVAGAVAGAQIGGGRGRDVAIATGAVLGALVGNEAGKSLDRADKIAMSRTTQNTLETQPSGTTATWRNPDSGNYGTVTPKPAVQTASGQYCREFQQTVTVGGATEQAYGTACRQPDGTWKIQ
ncbi:MAG: RT0821/Lpp0805 family surface protein [Acetobacterales bacterium]